MKNQQPRISMSIMSLYISASAGAPAARCRAPPRTPVTTLFWAAAARAAQRMSRLPLPCALLLTFVYSFSFTPYPRQMRILSPGRVYLFFLFPTTPFSFLPLLPPPPARGACAARALPHEGRAVFGGRAPAACRAAFQRPRRPPAAHGGARFFCSSLLPAAPRSAPRAPTCRPIIRNFHFWCRSTLRTARSWRAPQIDQPDSSPGPIYVISSSMYVADTDRPAPSSWEGCTNFGGVQFVFAPVFPLC